MTIKQLVSKTVCLPKYTFHNYVLYSDIIIIIVTIRISLRNNGVIGQQYFGLGLIHYKGEADCLHTRGQIKAPGRQLVING